MSLSQINPGLTEEKLRYDPEDKFLERKGRDTKHTKIANELIGMLNSGGGILVYGIANDGTVEDLSHSLLGNTIPKNLALYRKIIHDLIKPPANIDLEEVYLSGGELVFIYHVEPCYENVFQRKDNEDVFLRVDDSNNGPLNRSQVAKLEYNRGILKFEEELVPDFDEEDWDTGLCEVYRKAMNFKGSFDELAYKRNLCVKRDGHFVFKNAAVLIFAKDPERHIPNASVRYVRFNGTEQKAGKDFNVIKDRRFEGPIPRLIEEIKTFIEASLRDYYYFDTDKGRFFRVQEYPKDAWLEGIVNALCHRSYNVQGNPVMIRHFDDRLEIANSGPLPAQVTVNNILNEKFTRNVRLARTLNELSLVRELNEGVKRIFRVMKDFTLASPEYKDDGTTVTLTLRNKVTDHNETIIKHTFERIEKNWGKFNETQREILTMIFEQKDPTIREFFDHMDVSEQAIRSNLRKLIDLKIVEKVSHKERDLNAIYHFMPS